jgi:acetylornithine deacetylase/succinyl-diaminopimelate desuccinylase-like protein
MVYVELRVRTLSHDQHSGGAGLMPSAAWTMVRALSSLKDSQDRVTISGFYDDVREPSELDLHYLEENLDAESEAHAKELAGISQYVRGLSGLAAAREVFMPTCNIAGIVSGHTGPGPKTIVPAVAMAKLDFRLVPDQDPDDLIRKLRAHLDREGFQNVEVTVLGGEFPGKTDPANPYVQMCLRTAEEVYGEPPNVVPLVGGTGPVHPFLAYLGTPILTAGSGAPGAMVHAPNEHMRLDTFELGARHIARMILAFSEVGDRAER